MTFVTSEKDIFHWQRIRKRTRIKNIKGILLCRKGSIYMETVVKISNLVKRYKELVALEHLNLEIKEGEIFGLLGPNGSGKTTTINCILSLLTYDKGKIEVFGKEM